MPPLVTVLLPVHNAEAYVAEAVRSILGQTFSDFELLLINDGSTDNSLAVMQSIHDKRIRLVNNEVNIRLIATLNKGIQLAQGKYIARMDADDVSLPERLRKQVEFMEAHPQVGVCGTWFAHLGNTSRVVRYPVHDADIRIMMLYQTPFCHPSVIIRKEVLQKHQLQFSPDFIHGEDYELWARLSALTRFANIPEVLLHYRVHPGSVSASHASVQHEKTNTVIRMLFHKTGMTISNEEIRVFRDVAYSQFNADTSFIAQAERILMQLIEANLHSQFLPHLQLTQFVAEKWFHLCYNTTTLGNWVRRKYFSSSLPLLHVDGLTRFKFLLKTALRK